jgi:hypothetical protein
MSDKFDWNDEDDLVIPSQLAVAVYVNPKGEIVIRQQSDPSRDEDTYVVIAKSYVPIVIAALQRHLKDEV